MWDDQKNQKYEKIKNSIPICFFGDPGFGAKIWIGGLIVFASIKLLIFKKSILGCLMILFFSMSLISFIFRFLRVVCEVVSLCFFEFMSRKITLSFHFEWKCLKSIKNKSFSVRFLSKSKHTNRPVDRLNLFRQPQILLFCRKMKTLSLCILAGCQFSFDIYSRMVEFLLFWSILIKWFCKFIAYSKF